MVAETQLDTVEQYLIDLDYSGGGNEDSSPFGVDISSRMHTWKQDPELVATCRLARNLFPIEEVEAAIESYSTTLRQEGTTESLETAEYLIDIYANNSYDENNLTEDYQVKDPSLVSVWLRDLLAADDGWIYFAAGTHDGLSYSLWLGPYSEFPGLLLVQDLATGESGVRLVWEWID